MDISATLHSEKRYQYLLNQRHDCVLSWCGCDTIQFNLFCVHLILRGCDPSDMELVSTEIRLQISYVM